MTRTDEDQFRPRAAEPEITFADLDVDTGVQDQVRSVLRRIWQAGDGPTAVHVARLLDGGRSGAVVLQLDVRTGSQRSVRVLKVGPADDITKEWSAFRDLVRNQVNANVLCAPIEAATPGATGDSPPPAGELEGVVYNHVGQHGGRPDREVVTMEDLARAAYDGQDGALDRILGVIDTLFERADHALYSRHDVARPPRSLRARNPELGRDLRIDVDRMDRSGRLRHGSPRPDEITAALRLPEQVLRASLAGGRRTDPPVGHTVALNGLVPAAYDGHLIARRDDMSVEIEMPTDPERLRRSARRRSLEVYGVVVAARGAAHWDRMRAAFGTARRTATGIVADDVPSADPFGALATVVTDPDLGRVTAVVHGDLNPRNILVLDDQPYLIDYGRTAGDQPFLGDFAWLEIGLYRDVFADLGYADLVRVQRVLAFGSRLLDLAGDESVVAACLALLGDRPESAAVFRILFAIRAHGRRCYPAEAASMWWRDSVAQLLFAAHRTVKWPDRRGQLPAAVAMAAVASEWLADANPLAYWDGDTLSGALTSAIRILAFDRDEAVELVGQLIEALDDHGLGPELAELHDRVATQRFRDIVVARMVAESDEPFVDLTGDRVDGSVLGTPGSSALSLVADEPAAVLLGDAGAGKTVVARELARRLSALITGRPVPGPAVAPRLPVLLTAQRIAALLADPAEPDRDRIGNLISPVPDIDGVAKGLLTAGLLHLIVDDLDMLPLDSMTTVLDWLRQLRARFPRARILVCLRAPEPLGFVDVAIRDMSSAHIGRYLVARSDLDRPDADRVRRLLTDEQYAQLRRPLFVAMLADRAGGRPARSIGELYQAYFGQRLGDSAVAVSAAESLAEGMIDAGDTEAAESEALAPLIGSGVLRRAEGRVRFVRRDYADYFAARALLRADRSALLGRLPQLRWREPIRLLVSLPGASAETVGALVDAVAPVDPGRAADLLRCAGRLPREAANRFLADQDRTLRDAEAGLLFWQRAAGALAAGASSGARRVLVSVAVDPSVAEQAREAALEHLARDCLRSGAHDLRLNLAGAVHQILCRPTGPHSLALRVIAACELRDLALLAADSVDPDRPWPVVRDAVAALRAFGVVLTDALLARYRVSCHARLLDLERRLPGTGVAAEVRAMQQECGRLLLELASPDRVDLLVRRRFDFQLGDEVGDQLTALCDSGAEPTEENQLWHTLTGPVDPAGWLATAAAGAPLPAAAAAHRLLLDAPPHARRLLEGLTEDASADRLLIAAAAVPHLDEHGIDDADRLVRALLPVVGADRLAGLAALVWRIFLADRPRGVRLAWLADGVLIDRDLAERHGWPWHAAMATARGDFADLDRLLTADDEATHLALAGLASVDFHRDARAGPAHVFSSAARARLLSLAPSVDTEPSIAVRWACAAATTAVVDTLPVLRALVAQPGFGADAEVLTSGRYGRLDNAPLADLLACAGWLARCAYDADDHDDVEPTYRMLRQCDIAAVHPSVRIGRAVGLAYLGDWLPLLDELVRPDARITAAATHALTLWTPGPYPPAGLRDPDDIGRWLDGRIRDLAGHPEARSALLGLSNRPES